MTKRSIGHSVGDVTNSKHSILEGKSLPSSIRRLISDMLENETGRGNNGLFTNNTNAITTFRDVVCDLQQMETNSKSFLFDSLLSRWKPQICNKLYCREGELKIALEVAGRVHSHDGVGRELDEVMSVGTSGTEVIMLSGHSGECSFGLELMYF